MRAILRNFVDPFDYELISRFSTSLMSSFCHVVERNTNLRREYMTIGTLGFLIFYLRYGWGNDFVCNLIGFIYPAYISIISIENPGTLDKKKWRLYWITYVLLGLAEYFRDIFALSIPHYWLEKCLLLIWLMMAKKDNSIFKCISYLYTQFSSLLGHVQKALFYKPPPTWEPAKGDQKRFPMKNDTEEYEEIYKKFHEDMSENQIEIIKIERIQSESWFVQYSAHRQAFEKRLGKEINEKKLYHGCPKESADGIIESWFNRSFAGVNGVVYGKGGYFSSNARYSHNYAKPDFRGERNMFLVSVLVGKTTRGDSTMKTAPNGFDSTTDDSHIFVTYHDAQAYPEYLITYR